MANTSKIRLNTGGTLDPDVGQIWDREALIEEIERTLLVQSVYFTGERRMGKTSVISKMRAQSGTRFLVVYIDVEQIKSAGDFASIVYSKVTAALPALAKARGSMARGFKRRFGISKLGVGPVSVEFSEIVEKHWPDVLDEVVNALGTADDKRQIVVCFDELPQLLKNIVNAGEPLVARQVLDKLRELRQTHLGVRMIFTGSIGLHHVERDLRQFGSSWAPINDMKKIDIPSFDAADAEGLAEVLLTNEAVPCDDRIAVAAAIADRSDGVPYYIHWIVDGLLKRRSAVTAATVDEVVADALDDPDDAWGFRHQVNRVPEYYGEDQDLAYAVLDIVSQAPGLTFEELMRRVPAHTELDSRHGNRVRSLMELLERDHYLDASGGHLAFRRGLMQRAWKAKRYLAG